jgi:hypothetical protein
MATATVSRVWRRCDNDPPPEGVMVVTMSPGGMEQTLCRKGRLWFVDTDLSFYVYYVPQFWHPVNE